jgi:predicted phosphodiesterase
MIYLVGDTHGDIEKIEYFISKLKDKDHLIVLGDFGFVWNSQQDKLLDILETLPITINFIDGNHENFDMLEKYPIINKYRGCVSQVRKNIFWLRRGEKYTIEDKTFFCIGGASSIDKYNRVEFLSWWKQEDINYEESLRVLKKLKRIKKVDYVLTHTCPTSIIDQICDKDDFKKDYDTNSKLFELIYKEKLIEFDKWFFGHFHVDQVNGDFICLYNNMISVN